MFRSLYFWVIAGVISGALLGHFAPEIGTAMKPLADAFIKLIKMMIAPIIFCTVVTGIAGMRSMKNAGRVGFKAILYFEVVTTLALVIGLAVINISRPGVGLNITVSASDRESADQYIEKAEGQGGVADFILHMIPSTPVDAFARGDTLQVLVIAVLFAAGLLALGDKGHQLYQLIRQLSEVLFRIIGFIVRLAPLGAFGAMAYTVGKYGTASLLPLLKLLGDFYLTCALFLLLVLAPLMRLAGLSLWRLLVYMREELLLVLGTSSSETALPRLMEKMEKLGCSRPVVGMVVPTGYSFNLDGTSIYLTMAAIFVAQATNTPLTLWDQLLLLAVLLLTSKGAAGVTGSGFVVLAGSLAAVGHIPVEGLALILGVDRFMSEGRAITNFIGNAVGCVIVSRWEQALDVEQAQKMLT